MPAWAASARSIPGRGRDGRACRMGPKAHRVDDQHLDAGQDAEGLLGQAHDIVGVGDTAEPEAQGRRRAVVLQERHDRRRPRPRTARRSRDAGRSDCRSHAPPPRSSSRKRRSRMSVGAPVGPASIAPLAQRIGPEIVDAVHLVGMLVGPDHGVDPLDLGVEELGAQVGRGVDQDGLAAASSTRMEQRRRRLRGSAGSAAPHSPLPSLPADARHAARRAAAQDRHPHAARSALANRRKKLSVVACRERRPGRRP